MAQEFVCSLCHKRSTTAVCAWCGMVSDVDAVMTEAKSLYDAEGASSHRPRGDAVASALAAVSPPEDSASIVSDSATAPPGMVRISGGAFLFGEDRTSVNVPTFFIDRYPVTNSQYAEFVAETGHRPPRYWTDGKPSTSKLDHPVVGISVEDARAYLQWCRKSLPTEAEWEKAARGTDGRIYPWGDDFSAEMANVSGTEIKDTTAVGRFRQGASVYGCEELAGNVWEWTVTPYVSGGSNLALKGGSWYDFSTHARADHRFSAPSTHEGPCVGFRGVWRLRTAWPRHVPVWGGEASDAVEPELNTGRVEGPASATRVSWGDSAAMAGVVESTVGAFVGYDVDSAKERIDELFTPLEPEPMAARQEPATIHKTVEPRRFGAVRQVGVRWALVTLIVLVPLSMLGVVIFDSEDDAPDGPVASASERDSSTPRKPRGPSDRIRKVESKPAPRPAPRPRPTPRPRIPAPTPTPMPIAPTGMVGVPAGTFIFGDGERRREIHLPAFFIDGNEVTNEQFAAFVKATKYPAPRHTRHWRNGKLVPGFEKYPVTMIDHGAARKFAVWAGKRLPTEQEWEKAARGGDGRRYPWGGDLTPGRANLYPPKASQMGPHPVGSHPSGRSPFGCDDMCGNVLEWTSSREGLKFVLRGASWGLTRANGAVTFRYLEFPPESRSPIIGFRCVKDVRIGRNR